MGQTTKENIVFMKPRTRTATYDKNDIKCKTSKDYIPFAIHSSWEMPLAGTTIHL